MFRLMNIVSPWKRMVHGQAIWSYKQLLLLLEEISVFIEQVLHNFSSDLISFVFFNEQFAGPFILYLRSMDTHVGIRYVYNTDIHWILGYMSDTCVRYPFF